MPAHVGLLIVLSCLVFGLTAARAQAAPALTRTTRADAQVANSAPTGAKTTQALQVAQAAQHGPSAQPAQSMPPEPAAAVTAAPQPATVGTQPPAVPAVTPSPSAPTPAATPPTGRRLAAFRVTARKVTFYSNRFIIGADGDVVVTLGDGTKISGNTFFEDLRLNRFVIAGNVIVTAAGQTIHGAAFAEYFDFDRAYFIPITSEPDRWTFVAGDYAHPALGREMPGDTFFLPDLSGERVFLYAGRVVIDPRESARFAPADINFGLTFVTFPSYFLDFSANPNYAQNALPGAYADGPLDFAGGRHALATAHIRYDSQNKVFPAYEQHQISENSYFVGAISPLTRPFKIYNFVGYDRISPGLQAQLLLQESAFQHDFRQPLNASGFGQLQLTGSLRQSYLQFRIDQYYSSLLDEPKPVIGSSGRPLYFYGDPTHNWVPDHPIDEQLSWIGFRQPILRLPLFYQLRSSLLYVHNRDTPLQRLGGVAYHSEYAKGVGINVTTRSLPIIRDPRHRDLYFTASFDKQQQYFSVPHHTDTTTESVSFTKLVDPQKLAVLISYINSNIGDFYGKQQASAYSNTARTINPFTGQAYPGYTAFRGFATTRSFVQQLVYTPNPIFNLNFSMRENVDFPAPIPGPPQLVGDTVGFENFGLTPYQATLEVRYRINHLLVLDVARSYYFNFGGYERWQPQFSFQIEK